MNWARHKGLAAALEAAAWKDDHLVLLSVVGPREAVRGILAAAASGKDVVLSLEGGVETKRGYRGRMRLAALRRGVYHGVYQAPGLGKDYYVAREADLEREALWASRTLGKPIPVPWWPVLRPLLLLLGGRALELLLRASREARRGPVGLDRLPSAYFLWDRALLRGGADVPKALLPLVGIPRKPVLLPDPIGKVKEALEGLDAELWEGVRLEVAVVRGQRVVLAGWMGGSAQALIVHFSLGKIP
ncbi:hypothetical protein [Thermus scotoductus]|uniref:Uncharacterized protein n=1 Tax=Thermus scotoductus TaxID=37636 RepID=A0A430REA1_THESC|nr:hypothetical protein [Thermus scotoductus]RTG97625.1 hypothetical protein CSW49_02570 [Thermus scotoductus]RTH05696.1 hypothetical protein CSW45_02935 [Thermus scotoductus]RTH22226.1 hypothetical protein CSW42_03195 [Thermus scotoductus]RTI01815.1 hypothetical protein CSW28_02970 [Thermus scotoductus]RTI24196.1 hypothetical protein CSW21_03025 [Thermus scotoductus]